MVCVMKWEYKTVKFAPTGGVWKVGRLDIDMFTQKLNELGEEDWELVSIFDTIGDATKLDVVAVFKRSRSFTRLS